MQDSYPHNKLARLTLGIHLLLEVLIDVERLLLQAGVIRLQAVELLVLVPEVLFLQALGILLQAVEHLVLVESQQGLGHHLLVVSEVFLLPGDLDGIVGTSGQDTGFRRSQIDPAFSQVLLVVLQLAQLLGPGHLPHQLVDGWLTSFFNKCRGGEMWQPFLHAW